MHTRHREGEGVRSTLESESGGFDLTEKLGGGETNEEPRCSKWWAGGVRKDEV